MRKSALPQANEGAFIVSSSRAIKDDDSRPTLLCLVFEAGISTITNDFKCTGEYPNETLHEPMEFIVAVDGVQPPGKKKMSAGGAGIAIIREPHSHR